MNAPDADAPLVERVKQGDVKAFEMLVVKYQRRIERLIGRMVRDVDLVPDIAQETFIRAYRALPQFRGDSAFYTWLYRIAVNTAERCRHPGWRPGEQANRVRGELCGRSVVGRFEAGDHLAGNRRPQLRGNSRIDELPDRNGP